MSMSGSSRAKLSADQTGASERADVVDIVSGEVIPNERRP